MQMAFTRIGRSVPTLRRLRILLDSYLFTREPRNVPTAERVGYVADGDPVPRAGYLEASLERQVETCLRLRQPDNAFPPLGPLAAPNFDAVELCTLVDCEDFSSTDITSHGLPETGCYVMRDSWEPDAHYLFFDAQPSRGVKQYGDINACITRTRTTFDNMFRWRT